MQAVLTVEALQRCADQGMTVSEAARDLGVKFKTAWAHANRHAIVFKTKSQKCAEREMEYRACAESGMTRAETAAKLGVTRKAVDNAALRYGLSFSVPLSTRRLEWEACDRAGMTLREAADHFEVSLKGAYSASVRYGLNFDKRSQAPRSSALEKKPAALRKADRKHMALFWRRKRGCSVPLTPEEFARDLPDQCRARSAAILRQFARHGFLEARCEAGERIFLPTPSGAALAAEFAGISGAAQGAQVGVLVV